jgi:nicotinamidase-related amidase
MEQIEKRPALLVMDMQVGILEMSPEGKRIIGTVAKAIDAARETNIPVIYVVVGFRPGAPEVNLNNKSFGEGKARYGAMDMDVFMKVHPDLAPKADEVTVIKRRVSAFTGSDLEVVLRANNINHLILTGIATRGVVLSTVREAADKDYAMTVLSNGCMDPDEEVHNLLMTKIFPRQADVVTVEEWINK